MRPQQLAPLALLFPAALADFFVSNTSVCMGAILVRNCYHGAKVLTGVNNETDFTCPHLINAEDHHYIHNGTAGPFGSLYVSSEGGVCDSGRLDFEKDMEAYIVKDTKGEVVGHCEWDNNTSTQCNQWVGMLYFQSMFRCKSHICP